MEVVRSVEVYSFIPLSGLETIVLVLEEKSDRSFMSLLEIIREKHLDLLRSIK